MTNRITESMLESLCDRLNELTSNPAVPWVRDSTDKMIACVGNYHISHSYGGVCLHQTMNKSGGITTPLSSYHSPKRELWDKMQSFMSGIELTRTGD